MGMIIEILGRYTLVSIVIYIVLMVLKYNKVIRIGKEKILNVSILWIVYITIIIKKIIDKLTVR